MLNLKFAIRLLVISILITVIHSSDEYVKELHKKCFKTKRPYFCITYRISKYLDDFEFEGPANSVVKLVKISPESTLSEILPTPRYISSDSEWDKMLKFFQRKLIRFMSSHGISFEVPQGVNVVSNGRELKTLDLEEKHKGDLVEDQSTGRGKLKQKKIFILSILIVAKLVKILILVNAILFVLLLIKKIILVTAIVFPSVLSHIKDACQKAQHRGHQNHVPVESEAPAPSHSWFEWRKDYAENKPSWRFF